jgi:hypothetical protein
LSSRSAAVCLTLLVYTMFLGRSADPPCHLAMLEGASDSDGSTVTDEQYKAANEQQ